MMVRLLLLFVFISYAMAKEESYRLGQGLQIAQMPLYLGGYFSLEYLYSDDANHAFKVDDIALSLYGSYQNFSYMAEFEAKDIYTNIKGDEHGVPASDHFHIERLYLSYTFDEYLEMRVGKFNSSIGFWNLVPINVLRDTTSNPMLRRLLFPNFTSGIEVRYREGGDRTGGIDVMLQEGEDIDSLINDEIYNNFETKRHYGIGVLFEAFDISYRLNAGYFEKSAPPQKFAPPHEREFFKKGVPQEYVYFLGGFEYQGSDFKLLGELGTQYSSEGRHTLPYIGYLQYSYQPIEKHELVLRAESYKSDREKFEDSFLVFGYTYRPLAPVALKAEYQWNSVEERNRFLFSLSVLF
jgi:hypothetical protein